MAKFSSDRFPPGFFDLPPGAGETLPLDVIAEWTSSAQTREVARTILAPQTSAWSPFTGERFMESRSLLAG